MLLHELGKSNGKTKKSKRRGRGDSSGRGNYSTRGQKGQGQRSGGNTRPGFEGGQTPLNIRLPKLKGFKRPAKLVTSYTVVNLSRLEKHELFVNGGVVNKELLFQTRLLNKLDGNVKVLGNGDFSKKLEFVGIDKFSKKAIEKIQAAGGSITN
ncbi:MAG: 50S ribosomal protein L15 [Candidatus Absconditabacteria bacterium]